MAGGMSLGKHSNVEGFMSHGYFWSATEKDSGRAYYRYLYYDLPDFPYRIKMWKYTTTDVAGVSGKSEVIISFIDYSVK